MSYDSPIEIVKKMQEQYKTDIVNNVLKCVQSYGINVDKDELIKALKYDRQQYEKGYADGIKDRYNLLEEFVEWYKSKVIKDRIKTSKEQEDYCNEIDEPVKAILWDHESKVLQRISYCLNDDLEKFLEEKK